MDLYGRFDNGILTLQRAPYIEDGWYLRRDDNSAHPKWEVWDIAIYGGEEYLVAEFDGIDDAIKYASKLT